MAEPTTAAAHSASSTQNPDVLGQLRDMSVASSKRTAHSSEHDLFTHGQLDSTLYPPLYAPLYAQKPQEDSKPQIPGLTMVTMEEFDAEMRARSAVEEKERENNNFNAAHASKKMKPSSASPPGEPVLLIGKQNSAWVAKLNHLAQVHRLTATFDFDEEAPHSYSASLTLLHGNQVVNCFATSGTLFRSKKDAKDAVAEQAFVHLTNNPPAAKPKPVSIPSATGEVDKSENWMGLLNHFVQTCALPFPEFNDYQQGTNALFSTTCTLQLPANLGGALMTFGETDRFFPSKKASKVATAKEAVTFLRDHGALPKSGTKAGLHTSAAIPAETPSLADMIGSSAVSHTPATTAKNASFEEMFNPNHGIPTSEAITATTTTTFPGSNTSTQPSSDPPAADPSTTTKIITLCNILGLAQPQYRYEPDPLTPSFFSCAAYFPGEPDLRGAIGEVVRVFGKKAARGQCAKSVLEILEALKEERLRGF